MVAGITIVCTLGLIAVTLRWLVARSQARIVLDHTCASCGYIVRGLPGVTCPECGADLSQPAGVLVPRAMPPLPRVWLMTFWTVIFGLGFAAMEWAWLGRADKVSIIEADFWLGGPRSTVYDRVAVHFRGEAFRNQPLRGTAVITLGLLNRRPAPWRIHWDAATNRYRLVTDGASPGRDYVLDADAIFSWMRDCGVDVKAPNVRQEAESIADDVSRAARGDHWTVSGFFSGGGSGSSDVRSTRFIQGVRGSMVLAWIAGVVWLWRRRNRAWRVALVSGAPQPVAKDVGLVEAPGEYLMDGT